jgi:hypothetical protein
MRITTSIVLLSAIITSPIFAGNTNFYGSDGSYQGTMQSSGQNNSFIYGRNGEYVGSTAKAGSSTYHYGSDGSYSGSSQSMGNILTEMPP